MNNCLLKCLTIHFLEPFMLLLQLWNLIGLQIPGNGLLGFLVCSYLLFQEVVVYEANRAKVLLQQLSLGGIWI